MSRNNSPNFNSLFGFQEEATSVPDKDTTDDNDFGEGQGHLIHHHTPPQFFYQLDPHPQSPPRKHSNSPSPTFGSPTTTLNAGTVAKANDLQKAIENFGQLASGKSVPSNIDRRVEATLEQIPYLGNLLMDSIEAYSEERDGLRRDRAVSRKARELAKKAALEAENIKAEYVAKMAQMSVTPRLWRPVQGHMTSGTDTSMLFEATTDPFDTSELLSGFTELTPYKLNPHEALPIATGKLISELSDSRYNIEVVFCPPKFAEHEMTDFLRQSENGMRRISNGGPKEWIAAPSASAELHLASANPNQYGILEDRAPRAMVVMVIIVYII